MTDTRQLSLTEWLNNNVNLPPFQLKPLAGDASFRRYFRVELQNGSYIAMDAPPPRENCVPFIAIAKGLRDLGLNTPTIFAKDVARGFLLISDFGDKLFLKELTATNAEALYDCAIDALDVLRSCQVIQDWKLPYFSADFMRQELELFKEWFLLKHLNLNLSSSLEIQLSQCFDFIANTSANQSYSFMHRDYHSANLMILPHHQVGILDFQDAFVGPVTYDLVSLLRDCYIAWPDELVNKLVIRYFEKINLSNISQEQFLSWFEIMGLQRHLKALLTFSRKLHRDGNANYLQHIPRTLQYILKESAVFPECKVLYKLISEKVVDLCVQ